MQNGVSEVKYENFVERCVKRVEEKEMYEIQSNAGRMFLHEDLWDRWRRGLCFFKEMSEKNDVRETKSGLCRSQSTKCLPKTGSCFKSRSELRHRGFVDELLQRGRE